MAGGPALKRLASSFDDARQGDVAWLVEPEIGCDEAGKRHLKDFVPGIGLASYFDGSSCHLDLCGEGRLGPSQTRCQHLASLVVVVVGRLLAHEDEVSVQLSGDHLQLLGDGGRVVNFCGLHEDRFVGTNRKGLAELFLGRGLSYGHRDNDHVRISLAHSNGLFEGDFIERIYLELDAGGVDTAAIGKRLDLGVRVYDSFDRDKDSHGFGGAERDGRRPGCEPQFYLMAVCQNPAVDPFTTHTGRIAVVDADNVDTDRIIPARFLTLTTRSGYGDLLFRDVRGPDFALDRPEAQGSSILVVGFNFGCGSSREHAVWAIQQAGFRSVVAKKTADAPGYSDIFRQNAANCGLLLIELEESDHLAIASQGSGAEAEIDLPAQTISCGGRLCRFEINPQAKDALVKGLDLIGTTMALESQIGEYEGRSRAFVPA